MVAVTTPRRTRAAASGYSAQLQTWLSVASIGGPLALVALYLPPILADAGRHSTAVTLVGVAAFAAPTTIWWSYSRRVWGPGGLYAFTAAGAGRRLALAQAGLWIVSYLLYLLYTTDYVVYSILPAVIGGMRSWQPLLEIVVPLALVALVLAPVRVAVTAIAVASVGQIAIASALVVMALGSATRPSAPLPQPGIGAAASSAGQIGLLFVCASLPLFMGGDVMGRGRAVRRSLVAAVAGVAALTVVAALPGSALRSYSAAEVPGAALARDAAGRGFEIGVGVGSAVSVLALVAIEYLALTRLAHAVAGWSVGSVARWLAVPLIVAAFVSLSAPERFYDDLLRPSLVALWLAQLLPALAYPRFAARTGRLRLADVAVTVVAVALLGYGLSLSITSSLAT